MTNSVFFFMNDSNSILVPSSVPKVLRKAVGSKHVVQMISGDTEN